MQQVTQHVTTHIATTTWIAIMHLYNAWKPHVELCTSKIDLTSAHDQIIWFLNSLFCGYLQTRMEFLPVSEVLLIHTLAKIPSVFSEGQPLLYDMPLLNVSRSCTTSPLILIVSILLLSSSQNISIIYLLKSMQ